MIHEFDVAPSDGADFAKLITDWHEYAAMRRFSDRDAFFGDELSVPILYDPR